MFFQTLTLLVRARSTSLSFPASFQQLFWEQHYGGLQAAIDPVPIRQRNEVHKEIFYLHSSTTNIIILLISLLIKLLNPNCIWTIKLLFDDQFPVLPCVQGVHTRETVPVKINDDLYDDRYIQSFDMKTISAATNNLSPANKIGQGGFGPVYEVSLISFITLRGMLLSSSVFLLPYAQSSII